MKNLHHFGYCYTSFNDLYFDRLTGFFKIEKSINGLHEFKTFEVNTNRGYWFKVRIHLDDLKNHKDQFYWSIYGENISCLALFEMQTHLNVITVNDFIKNISSPYKVFKK